MATKSIRIIDPQGRVVLPNHIRKALNIAPGNTVAVSLADDGTIRLSVEQARCCICGKDVEGKHSTQLTADKLVCYECSQKIARAMLRT